MLTIEVLGPLRIGKWALKSKKAQALLAILAMAPQGQPVARSKIADLLWPCQTSEEARHSLRNCLLDISKALGPDYDDTIERKFGGCRLLLPTDVGGFEALAGSNDLHDLKEAAALYRGDLLDEFYIESEGFEEWLTAERDRLRLRAAKVFSRLSRVASASGDHDTAIAAGRRLVNLDSLDEESHRLLINAFETAGESSAAVRQYKVCEAIMQRELGVRPSGETESMGAAAFAHARGVSRGADARLAKDTLKEFAALQRASSAALAREVELIAAYRLLAEMKDFLTRLVDEKRFSPGASRSLLKKIDEIAPSGVGAVRELQAA